MCVFIGTRCSAFGRAGSPLQAALRFANGTHRSAAPYQIMPHKIFTDKQIRRAPDCGATRLWHINLLMTLSPPTALADADKLNALQRLDQFREWHSLDDKRYCLVCGKIITGRQIRVTGDAGGDEFQRLNCPTERCSSIPMDWALPTDEILAAAEKNKPNECNIAPTMASDGGVKSGATSHLRKLATQLKEAFYA